ncbi:hypothetical protein AB0C96_39105 [Streptomyces sp. NPDC048506]|uniref:hypothetical protein n=1 Tax=Streptomyces sp. NPDC048506 TaxID=3155028 RepID=UPI00344AEEC9
MSDVIASVEAVEAVEAVEEVRPVGLAADLLERPRYRKSLLPSRLAWATRADGPGQP